MSHCGQANMSYLPLHTLCVLCKSMPLDSQLSRIFEAHAETLLSVLSHARRRIACQTISKSQVATYHCPSIINLVTIYKIWILEAVNSVCESGHTSCDFNPPHFTYLKQNVWLLVENKEEYLNIGLWGQLHRNKTHIWRQNVLYVHCNQKSAHDIVYSTSSTRAEWVEKNHTRSKHTRGFKWLASHCTRHDAGVYHPTFRVDMSRCVFLVIRVMALTTYISKQITKQ